MALFSRNPPKSVLPPDADLDALLKGYEEAIMALADAILAGEENIDIVLAEMVEGAQSQQRIAIVEKLRALVRSRSEEKAEQLDQVLEAQKLLEHHRQQVQAERWLAWFMSQETLKKIRESLMVSPSLKNEVEQTGQELARKGLLQPVNPAELGTLSQNLPDARGQDRGKTR